MIVPAAIMDFMAGFSVGCAFGMALLILARRNTQ